MSVKLEITMPEGDKYKAVMNHWLPRLLGSDDTVYGETAYFRLRFFDDNSLAGPSAGHLGHGGVHVRQFRALKKKVGIFAYIAWPFVWIWNSLFGGGTMEAQADLYAEMNKTHPTLVNQYTMLRSMFHKSSY